MIGEIWDIGCFSNTGGTGHSRHQWDFGGCDSGPQPHTQHRRLPWQDGWHHWGRNLMLSGCQVTLRGLTILLWPRLAYLTLGRFSRLRMDKDYRFSYLIPQIFILFCISLIFISYFYKCALIIYHLKYATWCHIWSYGFIKLSEIHMINCFCLLSNLQQGTLICQRPWLP